MKRHTNTEERKANMETKQHSCGLSAVAPVLGRKDLPHGKQPTIPAEAKYSKAACAGPWNMSFPEANKVRLSNNLKMEYRG